MNTGTTTCQYYYAYSQSGIFSNHPTTLQDGIVAVDSVDQGIWVGTTTADRTTFNGGKLQGSVSLNPSKTVCVTTSSGGGGGTTTVDLDIVNFGVLSAYWFGIVLFCVWMINAFKKRKLI